MLLGLIKAGGSLHYAQSNMSHDYSLAIKGGGGVIHLWPGGAILKGAAYLFEQLYSAINACTTMVRLVCIVAENAPYACGNFYACAFTRFQKPQQLGWAWIACSSRHVRSEPGAISAASAVPSCGWNYWRRKRRRLFVEFVTQWRTQKGVWGFSPQKNFGFSGLKCAVFKFRDPLPNVFSQLMLPVVVAQSYYSFTPAVCAFLQAPPLQGRKLVIGWKTREVRKALLDVVELWRKNFPPYSLCLSQKLPTVHN